MQYFKDRAQAGDELTKLLLRYRDSQCVVVALSAGGVLVGARIAENLHLPLGMLAVKEIHLPWKDAPIVGSVDSSGEYTKNISLGEATLADFEGEYRSYIDQEILRATHEINLMHVSNIMKRERLNDKAIILVTDGLKEATPIREALAYLKPVRTTRILAAMPVATVEAIDYLHVSVDEIHCLDVKANYLDTDHYYEADEQPNYEELTMLLVKFDTIN